MESIYLDHNSTTPLAPEAQEAMRPFWAESFGNPASAHHIGRRARQALEDARETVAALLDASPDEVLFTSGATESNNLALFGLAGSPPGRIILSPVEHPSVTEPVMALGQQGFAIATLAVDSHGVVLPDSLPTLGPDVRLITAMLANNETGAIQPIRELVQRVLMANQQPIFFHCDAAQAVGKIPVSFRDLQVSSLSLSAHKFNGPRGVGALLLKKNSPLRPLFQGGHQQRGLRPGTEPVALAVGLAKALQVACRDRVERTTRVASLRQRFLDQLRRTASPVVLNGPEQGGLPNTLNLSFPGCRADLLLIKLDLAGICCSTGSACSSGSLLPSPVLRAMGCAPEVLESAMRFSLSHLNTDAEIAAAAERIAQAVRQLRQRPTDERRTLA